MSFIKHCLSYFSYLIYISDSFWEFAIAKGVHINVIFYHRYDAILFDRSYSSGRNILPIARIE